MKILQLIVFFTIMAQISSGQDWANLEKYAQSNKDLMSQPSLKSRVVFMGNSITEGWVNASPDFWQNESFINRGISGQTTPQMLVRFRPDVIALRPDIVVILAGTNDIAGNTGPMTLEEIMGNIASMAELAQAHHIGVVLCSVLPAKDYPWRPGLHPDEKIPQLNAMIKEYADTHKCLYLDYFSEMATAENGMKPGLASDEVHPTPQGYKVMESMISKALSKVVSTRK